ncbi:hypothetical protein KR032_006316 [Drosophila birchii]|nr:hypothetical protein KR032_006316 [Drosophila birchii]
MAPSNMEYQNESQTTESYTHKKFKTSAYTHKKFSKKTSSGKEKEATATSSATPLFRPYALSENTPRKRRQVTEIQLHHQLQYHSLPPTPPTTPPQQQQHQLQHAQYPVQSSPLPAATMTTPTSSNTPVFSHQAYAYMLQKQRAVLQMRQLLSINPDANTWPVEWRQALQALLHQ